MEELWRMGRQALESQPFGALLGARLASFSEGEATLEVPIREELLQQGGFVHGGVVGATPPTTPSRSPAAPCWGRPC